MYDGLKYTPAITALTAYKIKSSVRLVPKNEIPKIKRSCAEVINAPRA